MLQGYALLKTLAFRASNQRRPAGGRRRLHRLQAACGEFLDAWFSRSLYSVAREGDAFAALAVRMAGEETGLTARYKSESIGNMALKHGW